MNWIKKIIPVVFFIGAAAILFLFRIQIQDFVQDFFKPQLPAPISAEEFNKNPLPTDTQISNLIPQTFNLNVPFGSQAPFANWDMPYQEACEEAAAIMVHYYYESKQLTPKIMNEEILKLVEWENKTFGYYEDTKASEIARILHEYFGHKNVEVRYEFAINDIKEEIAQGRPVILPAAGRLLPNPNFRQPGPIYHALVAKGYTENKIITNDPGTRKGHDFLYDPKELMNALHEWNEEDILKGGKAMVVVKNPKF